MLGGDFARDLAPLPPREQQVPCQVAQQVSVFLGCQIASVRDVRMPSSMKNHRSAMRGNIAAARPPNWPAGHER